jgi:hypothetical protein
MVIFHSYVKLLEGTPSSTFKLWNFQGIWSGIWTIAMTSWWRPSFFLALPWIHKTYVFAHCWEDSLNIIYVYIYIHLYNIYLHLFPSIKQHLCPPVQSRYPNIPEGSCAHISPWLPMNTPIVHGWLIHFPIFWTVPRKIPFAGYNTTCGCDRFKPIVPIGDS